MCLWLKPYNTLHFNWYVGQYILLNHPWDVYTQKYICGSIYGSTWYVNLFDIQLLLLIECKN